MFTADFYLVQLQLSCPVSMNSSRVHLANSIKIQIEHMEPQIYIIKNGGGLGFTMLAFLNYPSLQYFAYYFPNVPSNKRCSRNT